MRKFLLALTVSLVPLSASAQALGVLRPILLPRLQEPSAAVVDIDSIARAENVSQYGIIDSQSIAVASVTEEGEENIMPSAIIDAVPLSADTVPKTSAEQMKDGNRNSFFQPVTEPSYVFRFHFTENRTPTALKLVLAEGRLESVRVRIGSNAGALKDALVGSSSETHITLSGEQMRVMEVTITLRQGVLKIAELELLQPRTQVRFLAQPGQSYKLLYNGYFVPRLPLPAEFYKAPVVAGSLGGVQRATKPDDYDGIPDTQDLCPGVFDPEQKDADSDGFGDACDNCPQSKNADQLDADSNGRGDVCDDADQDGIMNAADNCPAKSNPQQQDEDKDGVGNVCDDTDSRWSEDKPWLVWASMGAVVVMLVGLAGVVLVRAKE